MNCNNRQSAFTLIELLSVIAVVSVLFAISAAVYGQARQKAEEATCASNMRQLGQAMHLHANEHAGEFPLTMHTLQDVKQSWIYTLEEYLGDIDQIRICPADPQGEERMERKLTSYVLNEYLFVPAVDPFGQPIGNSYSNLFTLAHPSKTQMAYIISDNSSLGVSSDHTHSRSWSSWSNVMRDIQPNRFSASVPSGDGMNGSANYLYADGHVESMTAQEFRDQFSGGINPADPAQL
ncbi:MAG: prepilin-type N-terminal cleavage/methylation domain-containing protein [Verrucomicrobiota bacterium]